MCGRFVSPDQAAIERAWQIDRSSSNPFVRRFNVAPAAEVALLRLAEGARVLEAARWGLIPAWWQQARLPTRSINARLEEAAAKPMWREPMRRMRCLVPAEGWYEWRALAGGRQPHYIVRRDRRPFCFAGLFALRQDALSCAILTKPAAGPVTEVHDRMPVVLPDSAFAGWLDPGLRDATGFAQDNALAGEFEHYPVSKRVNDARNEGADLIEPLAA